MLKISVEKLERNVITPPAVNRTTSEWNFERRVASFPDVREKNQSTSTPCPQRQPSSLLQQSIPMTRQFHKSADFKSSYFNCMDSVSCFNVNDLIAYKLKFLNNSCINIRIWLQLDFLKWKQSHVCGRYQCVTIEHDVHDLAGFPDDPTLAATDARKVNVSHLGF